MTDTPARSVPDRLRHNHAAINPKGTLVDGCPACDAERPAPDLREPRAPYLTMAELVSVRVEGIAVKQRRKPAQEARR